MHSKNNYMNQIKMDEESVLVDIFLTLVEGPKL